MKAQKAQKAQAAAAAPAAWDAETGALARVGIGLGSVTVALLAYTAAVAADLLQRYG